VSRRRGARDVRTIGRILPQRAGVVDRPRKRAHASAQREADAPDGAPVFFALAYLSLSAWESRCRSRNRQYIMSDVAVAQEVSCLQYMGAS
jgi:hypothetical protein